MSTQQHHLIHRVQDMLTPEELREKLEDRVIKVVAEKTGLHYNTVLAISKGTSSQPSYGSIKILSEYFEEND